MNTCEKIIHSSSTSDSDSAREAIGSVHLIQTVKHMSARRRHPGAKPATVGQGPKDECSIGNGLMVTFPAWGKQLFALHSGHAYVVPAQCCSVVRALFEKKVDLSHAPAQCMISPNNGRSVFYCIVLYCIVLYLYYIVSYGIILYCIILYCVVLYCIVLYCIALYLIALYCITMYAVFILLLPLLIGVPGR